MYVPLTCKRWTRESVPRLCLRDAAYSRPLPLAPTHVRSSEHVGTSPPGAAAGIGLCGDFNRLREFRSFRDWVQNKMQFCKTEFSRDSIKIDILYIQCACLRPLPIVVDPRCGGLVCWYCRYLFVLGTPIMKTFLVHTHRS